MAGHPIEKEQLKKFKQWLTKHLEKEKPVEKENPPTDGTDGQSVKTVDSNQPNEKPPTTDGNEKEKSVNPAVP